MLNNGFKLEVESLISKDISYVTENTSPSGCAMRIGSTRTPKYSRAETQRTLRGNPAERAHAKRKDAKNFNTRLCLLASYAIA